MLKTIGILGGMGPAATADLMTKIISMTDAPDDQHHIPMLVDNNPLIPDRTAALMHHGEDPVPEMLKSARRLEAMGADFLIVPCNTAHCFVPAIEEQIGIPILSMPDETAASLHRAGVKRAAVLATEGTVQSGLYDTALAGKGIEALYPSDEQQQVITQLIYENIKHGICDKDRLPVPQMQQILSDLHGRGAQVFLLACTELPIAFEHMEIAQDCVDPTTELAVAAITKAGASPLARSAVPRTM